MNLHKTQLNDVLIIEPQVFGDERGFFYESFNKRTWENAGLPAEFVQDNHSRSERGVLRGLHYQVVNTQGKLVRVVVGEVFDVVVDLREDSTTFKQWFGINLSAENKLQLWVPEGFAHGFLTLSDSAEVLYKATDFYNPIADRSLLWNDPEIGILWPDAVVKPTLSNKDKNGASLKEALAEKPFRNLCKL